MRVRRVDGMNAASSNHLREGFDADRPETTLKRALIQLVTPADEISGSLFERLLQEIDSIMLPREVQIWCVSDVQCRILARFTVSQRRLLEIDFLDNWEGDLIDGVRALLDLMRPYATDASTSAQKILFRRYVAHAPICAESLSTSQLRDWFNEIATH